MKIDPICGENSYRHRVEVYCSAFPDGIKGLAVPGISEYVPTRGLVIIVPDHRSSYVR